MTTRLATYTRWLLPALTLTLAVGACTTPTEETTSNPGGPVTTTEYALQPFDNCSDFRDYLGDVALEQLVRERYSYGLRGELDGAGNNGAPAADNSGGGAAPTDYTTTNVQEEGVDEADFVKTDGTHIYITQNNALFIVKSWPIAETSLASKLDLDFDAYAMFLKGDRVILMSYYYNQGQDTPDDGRNNGTEPASDDDFILRNWGGTRLTVVDVSDRENPSILRNVDLEGYYAQGRMIDGDVYLVLNTWLPLPQALYERIYNDPELELPEPRWDGTDAEREDDADLFRELIRPIVEDVMANADVNDMIPRFRDQHIGATAAPIEPMLGCNDIYRPSNVSQYGMLSVLHVNLDDDHAAIATTAVLSNGWTLYASQDNLYVAFTSWWWWWGWGQMDDLSTHIHKFELRSDDGHPRYVASGKVDGWLLNQFSMSEFGGYLRVASTDSDWWWGTQEEPEGGNHITILDDKNGVMSEIGSVRDIAPGEQITASRMLGNKGYLVTFRQTDPLFTIDLTNPRAPRLVGELQVPGFSAYLHPMDEDHLLAVGMDGDESGTNGKMQVSIFDVSDFANPALAHKLTIGEEGGWAWSEALWDHHAFTYHRGVLSIPAYTYTYDEGLGRDRNHFGLLVLGIDAEAGITEIGRVDHTDLLEQSECPYDVENWGGTEADREWYCNDYYYYGWYNQMRRSIYIEDNVFSISTIGLKVSPLNQPETTLGSVLLQ